MTLGTRTETKCEEGKKKNGEEAREVYCCSVHPSSCLFFHAIEHSELIYVTATTRVAMDDGKDKRYITDTSDSRSRLTFEASVWGTRLFTYRIS